MFENAVDLVITLNQQCSWTSDWVKRRRVSLNTSQNVTPKMGIIFKRLNGFGDVSPTGFLKR